MLRRIILSLLLLAAVAGLVWPGESAVQAANADQEWLSGSPAAVPAAAQARVPAAPPATPHVNVAIQAGHWKIAALPDPLARLRGSTGTSGGGRTEVQVNLDIAQRVVRRLRDKGLTAEVLPATVPTGYQADLFIALHADGSSSAAPRGYKVSTRWRSDVAGLDAVLVQAIQDGYSQVTGLPEDGSITRAMRGYYAYSTYRGEEYRLGATTPAAIIEMGFMSNAADRNVMFNNPELIARGVVAGIDNFYARRAAAQRLQAAAERQAAAGLHARSAVVLADSANIRSTASSSARRVAGAAFGDSFPLLDTATVRPPNGPWDPRQGTQLVTGSGWYKIALPGATGDAYISRDLVVIQQ